MPAAHPANRELLVLRYVASRAPCLRVEILEAYRPQLARLARRWSRNLPNASFDLDDLLQIGAIELLRALECYDPKHPDRVSFERHLVGFTWKEFAHVFERENRRRTSPMTNVIAASRIDGAAIGVAYEERERRW